MNKKGFMVFVVLIALSVSVGAAPAAAGPYDGLWTTGSSDQDFQMIRSVGEHLLIIGFALNNDYLQIWMGTVKGDTIDLTAYNFNATARATIVSDTKMEAVITSCAGPCEESVGQVSIMTKVF